MVGFSIIAAYVISMEQKYFYRGLDFLLLQVILPEQKSFRLHYLQIRLEKKGNIK